MKTKDLSKMAILDRSVIQKVEKGRFVIDKDYNLNDARLVVPKGITIDLSNGSINNGTLVLDDTLLVNMSSGSIDARIEGTLRNSTIYTSTFGGINNLNIADYSDKTIKCDYLETNITSGITISAANANGTTETIFDGLNNSFPCSASLFIFSNGAKNVTIKNFNATSLTPYNSPKKVFVDMNSANSNYKSIKITGNHILNFNVGISLNNDNNSYIVSDCLVKDNTIESCIGTNSGYGYGIHMANAYNCIISSNIIKYCQRHSIYHAYGGNNHIINNYIAEHRKNITDYSPRAAIDICRKSKNILVKNNSFIKCNNICIYISSIIYTDDGEDGATHRFRYGHCENIIIEENAFIMAYTTENVGGLSNIMIGNCTHSYTELENADALVKEVFIINNTFDKTSSESQKCIRVDQCLQLSITGNSFQFSLPSSPSTSKYWIINFQDTTVSTSKMLASIIKNIFTYYGTNPGSHIFVLGDYMSLVTSQNNPDYVIKWFNNNFNNQGTSNYEFYEGTAGDGLIVL